MKLKIGLCTTCKGEILKDLKFPQSSTHFILYNVGKKESCLFDSKKCLKEWADKEEIKENDNKN